MWRDIPCASLRDGDAVCLRNRNTAFPTPAPSVSAFPSMQPSISSQPTSIEDAFNANRSCEETFPSASSFVSLEELLSNKSETCAFLRVNFTEDVFHLNFSQSFEVEEGRIMTLQSAAGQVLQLEGSASMCSTLFNVRGSFEVQGLSFSNFSCSQSLFRVLPEGSVHIMNSYFSNNTGKSGSVLSVNTGGNANISSTTFYQNRARVTGGAVFMSGSISKSKTITNSLLPTSRAACK